MLDYKIAAENESMYNTPPCFALYVCGLVFAKLLKDGGLEAQRNYNAVKAKVFSSFCICSHCNLHCFGGART